MCLEHSVPVQAACKSFSAITALNLKVPYIAPLSQSLLTQRGRTNTRVNVICISKRGRKGAQHDAHKGVLVRGCFQSRSCLTYTGWQGLIPSSPLPSQADQHPAASQSVARVTAEGYWAASKVSLVMYLVTELWDARVLTFNEFKTWSGRNSICFNLVFNSQEILTQIRS